MRKLRFLYYIAIFLLISVAAHAQRYQISDTTDHLDRDISRILSLSNLEGASATADNFSSVWGDNKLNNNQKGQIATIVKNMVTKGQRARELEYFAAVISYAITERTISQSNLNGLLELLEKSVAKYNNDKYTQLLITLKSFFKEELLYNSNYNRLYALNYNYSFEFIENEVPEPQLLPESGGETEANSGFFDSWDQSTEETESADDWGASGWGEENSSTEQPADATGWDSDNSWEAWDDTGSKNEGSGGQPDDVKDIFRQNFVPLPQPEIEGAVLKFEKIDFNIATTYDSAFLKGASGSLMLHKNLFVGKGGKFDWSPAGLNPDEVFCTLEEYNFEIDKPRLEAEQVKLTYRGLIKDPVEGVFEFDSKRHENPKDAVYPRFKSFYSDTRIDNLGHQGVIYTGAFSLRGDDIVGSSVYPGISTILVQDESGVLYKVRGEHFVLKDSALTAGKAEVVIFHSRDSIYHPSVKYHYSLDDRILTVLKPESDYKVTPFISSYYNMDIQADLIKWDLNSDSLNISILNAKKHIPATFESREFFSDDRFNRLSGYYGFNPLLVVVSYARKKNSGEFYVDELATYIKQKVPIVKAAVRQLKYRNYIDFNELTGVVKIKKKGFHNVLAKNFRIDYDDLLIPSLSINQPNATLSLENQEMKVRGIERFYISKLLDVYLIPEENTITLLKNRDFKFDGQLYAGNFEFVGREFTFRYDSFLIDLQQIDSIRFYVEVQTEDSRGKNRQKVDNFLVVEDMLSETLDGLSANLDNTNGTLYINRPDNKSGRKIYPNYPRFDANKGAVVYFNKGDILDSAYDGSIYFVIPPFAIDSLSDSDPAAISFAGKFVGGGIFPDFEEKLQIMPDNSMGFVHNAPEDGYALYGGAGKVYDKITLDKKGLQSFGKIEYLTTTLESAREPSSEEEEAEVEGFTFYLDSMVANGSRAVIESGTFGGVSFPSMKVDNYHVKWLTQKDSMYISNLDKPIQLYDSTATLDGTAIVNKNGTFGKGTLFTRASESVSREFDFEESRFNARHAEFEIKSDNPKKPALAGDDVRLNFDLDQEIADISPEIEGVAAIDFPYSQFKTSISQAKWDLKNKKVTMSKPEDVDIRNSYFYTTREELDSLNFNATGAEYNIETQELKVNGIPYIVVADAKITPENNELLIKENAMFGELQNTTIVMDTLNEYHNLSNGTINIVSRQKFLGKATYQYVNANRDTFEIQFNSFNLEEKEERRKIYQRTVSSGEVSESDRFVISPGMIYKGKVTMYADQPALELDGFVKLDFQTMEDKNTWISYYSNDEERQEIQFDFANSITQKGEPLTAGVHFDPRRDSLYVTFISDKVTPGDDDLFVPNGMLRYDNENNVYRIEDTLKITGQSFSGRVFTFNENTQNVEFEGPLNFINNILNQGVEVNAAGMGKGNYGKSTYDINAFLTLDYDIPDNAVQIMAADIFEIVERLNAPEANADQTILLYKAAEIIGESAAKLYDTKSLNEYVPLVSASNKLIKDLVISDINLKWSPKHSAWYSEGPIGISNILREDVNALMDGFVEIRKTDEGDVLNVFIQIAPDSWFFFNYQENRLITFSSNDEYNEIITDKTNVNKANLGEYVFVPGDIAETLSYINRFRKNYLGIDEPYQMDYVQPVEVETTLPTAEELPKEEEEKISNETEGF